MNEKNEKITINEISKSKIFNRDKICTDNALTHTKRERHTHACLRCVREEEERKEEKENQNDVSVYIYT